VTKNGNTHKSTGKYIFYVKYFLGSRLCGNDDRGVPTLVGKIKEH